MRRGFTILELLVASLLLGMLVTILTMIFNQSAIAWRTGKAGVADLDEVRDKMAEIREEADNVFVANQEARMITGLWDSETGALRDRACDAASGDQPLAKILRSRGIETTGKRVPWSSKNVLSVGSSGSSGSIKTYTVNVKSAGPDRVFGTYDDVWSWPDEFE